MNLKNQKQYKESIEKSLLILSRETEKKTLFDLGKQTNKDIEPTTDYIDETVPDDVSMNLGKLEKKIC